MNLASGGGDRHREATMRSLRRTIVALILGVPTLAIVGCPSEDERIAELERLDPDTLVYLALTRPLTPDFEEPTTVEPQILAVLARAPERYLPVLATYLDAAYDANGATSPSRRVQSRATELVARHLGEPGRALLRRVYELVRADVKVLEDGEKAASEPHARSDLQFEHRRQVASYQALEACVLRVFTEEGDASLADSVIAKLRCYNPTVLEAEVNYLQTVNRLDQSVQARVRDVIETMPGCPPVLR